MYHRVPLSERTRNAREWRENGGGRGADEKDASGLFMLRISAGHGVPP